MPYIPDLIPKESKIVPEYFAKQSQLLPKCKAAGNTGQVLLGLLFLAVAVFNIRYVGFALLFALLAVSCTGAGKRWLESAGRFSLAGAARLVIYGIMFLVSVPVFLTYKHQDEVDAAERVVAHQQALQFTADSLKADSGRQRELFALLTQANKATPDSGLRVLARTDGLVKTEAEKDSVNVIFQDLQLQLVQKGLANKNYQGALAAVQKLLDGGSRRPELWFYRARCYIGLKNVQLAVSDLDSARALSYKPAERLYDQVNPLKRHITGYTTICNDGSTSSATGRGACSWHGGVAEWNHPIYETYRKYGE